MERCGELTPQEAYLWMETPSYRGKSWVWPLMKTKMIKKKTTKLAPFAKRITMLPTNTMAVATSLTKEC